jgi:hypothetical protein
MELFLITIVFLVLNMIVLRKFAKEEMFEGYIGLLISIVVSFIPIVNIVTLIFFLVTLLINKFNEKYDNIDDFAKAIFFIKIKKKNDDIDNFKGKGYR